MLTILHDPIFLLWPKQFILVGGHGEGVVHLKQGQLSHTEPMPMAGSNTDELDQLDSAFKLLEVN